MQPALQDKLKIFFTKYKKIITLTCLGLIILIFISLYLNSFTAQERANRKDPSVSITPFLRQEDFRVTSTAPENEAISVSTGEIGISFETDKPIVSEKSFGFSISPSLPNYWKFVNSYPSRKITAQVLGGLKENTRYTLTVSDTNGQPIHSWTFTTSKEPNQSSSGLVREEEEQLMKDYYPLLNYLPYSTTNFSIDYIDRLTLIVTLKSQNIEVVKKQVDDWIKSKGVDPSTHTINYQNNP